MMIEQQKLPQNQSERVEPPAGAVVLDHAMQQIQRPRVSTRCRPSAMLLLIVLVPLGLQNLLGITFENVSLGRFVSQLLCTTSSYPAQQHGERVTSVIESVKIQQESNRTDIPVSLYCFMVCHPIEANLLRAHLELGTLHGCDCLLYTSPSPRDS